ncbi:bifunctional DNA primase/helicase [Mucilaginibacter sp. CSA2-8R]|uniref:bifunctional DNA primase/helicase n=1 Tax=Mucilaginibacter sp. CSA2-8R TaxID=3141542 RepID=UPI00315D7391
MSQKEKLQALGIDLKRITTTGKTLCPKCSHQRRHKNDPCLSVNIPDGTYHCHHCGWKGRALDMAAFERKTYVRPTFVNRTPLSKPWVDWFAARGIRQQTLIDLGVTEGPEWMPGAGGTVSTVQFNYLRGGELINIKYRDALKHFKLSKDAELIFYNLDSLAGQTECIICEGEPDALSWHQSGYPAVVSVPNGASANARMEYLDACFGHFEGMTTIYLSCDDDAPGHALRDELARRLGVERCLKVDFEGLKDANEYLMAYGEERLRGRLAAARAFPIAGVYTVDELWPGVMDIYHNGLPQGAATGDDRFDQHLRFMPGELTTVTGVPSHGKSVFLEQLSLQLCLNAGWKFAIFAPETYPREMFLMRLIKKVIGKPATKANITEADMEKMRDWLQSRFHIIYPEEEGFSLDILLEKARRLVLRYGINGLILDPWNRIENTMPAGYNESKFTAEQLIKIVKFNQHNGVHTFLVAHPTKMPKQADGNFEVPNLYSISGSAHFFNITQNGFTVYRNRVNGHDVTEIHIQKVKWEHLGRKGLLEYRYCPENTRLLAPGECLPSDTASWIPGVADERDRFWVG